MTSHEPAQQDSHERAQQDSAALGVRTQAAALFGAAARTASVGIGTGLDCLAAQLSLQVPDLPSPRPADPISPDALIVQALQILARVPADQFADPRIRDACRYGRRALRGPR